MSAIGADHFQPTFYCSPHMPIRHVSRHVLRHAVIDRYDWLQNICTTQDV